MKPWVFLAAAYVLGSFPTSLVVGKLARGIDLRQHGSGNLGATNALRVLGWRLALPVLVVDVWKGWFPTYCFPRWDGGAGWEWALAYGAAAIAGHVFSVFVRFRGGKGVATSAGVFLALAPAATLAGLVAWGVVVALTRMVSAASLVAAFVLPVAVYVFQGPGAVLWLSVGVSLFVVYAHRANIRRLLAGEEHRFGRREGGTG
ncbi:MAG TPA: glycerol-3-phosphate 1-O-acyltransferase PlsY [Longimicrobiales bacterium]